MRRLLLAGLAAWFCAVAGGATTAVALELNASADLDYSYVQEDLGGAVNAETLFNQKYEIKYTTSLTTAHDFLGAVRLDLQDAWYTDQASTSRVAPTLEMATKGSQLAAKLAYEVVVSSTDAYRETSGVDSYSSSLALELEMTPDLWPEVKLKLQRRRDLQELVSENTTNTFEFSARKDIYGLRLEYNFKREDSDDALPARTGRTGTAWSAKAAYKEILWGGAEFEFAYELNETYTDERSRGVFSGETSDYNQTLKTRLKKSLVIAPRMTLGLEWEYQFDQDLLALEYDYKLKNKYVLDLRWDAYDWLKFTSEARRETDLTAAVDGEDDERAVIDGFKAGFDLTSISWLRVSGKAEFRSEDKIVANTGGSVDKIDEEKYELIVKNRFGDFWDLTVDATTTNKHTDNLLTNRETKVKTDLKLKLFDLAVTPSYEVSRTNEWEQGFDFPISQQQVRDAKIKFDYQMQLLEMFKATFSHEYDFKVDDTLDEVLNFERILQFSEDTRLTVVLAEIVRDLRLEGEIDRRASDTMDDPDPELVELAYTLKLDWKYEDLTLLSSIKYNDKGDTFDDLSFNAKATWKRERLELTGEYQFDKIIKDSTEPKDEKRKLNLKLNYRF
ncbi:MAG: hypothetical protein ACYC9Y_09485 [Candidatus Methylomirabilia bacterium]